MKIQTFIIITFCMLSFSQLCDGEPQHPILTISGSGSGASTVTNIPESTYTNNFTPRTPPRNDAQGFVPAVVSGDTGWSWSSSSPTQIVSTPSGTVFPNTNSAYPLRTQVVTVFLTTATNNLTTNVNAVYYNKAGSTTSKSMVINLIDMHKRDQLRSDFNKLAPAYVNSGSTPATRNDNYARRIAVSLLDWARWHPLYYLTAINSPTYINVTTNYSATTGGFGPQRASDHNGLAHEWQVDELNAFDAIYSSVVLTNMNTEMGFNVRQYICDNLFFDEGDFLINHIPVDIAIQSNLSGPYAVLPQVARVLDRPDYIIWLDVYLDATVRQKIRRDGALEEGEGYSIGYLNSNQDAAQNTSDYFLTRAATNSLLFAISNRAKIYNTSLTYGQAQWATMALPNGQLPSFGDTPFNTYFSARNNGNSSILPAYGTLSMGAGTSSSTAVQVNQNFSGDNNHMRADMNAFVLWAFNNEYLGNIRYYNGSIGRNWGEQILEKNDIEIDRVNLTPYTDADTSGNGNLTIYEPGNNGLAMTELDGQRGYSSKASRFQRMLLLNTVDISKPYVVDVFRVTGGTNHDYMFHGSVRWNQKAQTSFSLVTNNNLYPMLEGSETWDPANDVPYYGFWRNVNSNAAPGNFQITYADTNRATGRDTKLWMTADPNVYNVYVGTTPVPARDDTVPTNFFNSLGLTRPSTIIRHRVTSGPLQDLFVSVFEPFNVGVSNIVSVQRLTMSNSLESCGLKVTFKDGRTDTYIVDLRNLKIAGASGGSAAVGTADGQYALTGRVGMHVDRPTSDPRVWTINATDFKYPNRELSTPINTYYSGWIAGETRKLDGATYDAFTTTTLLPTNTALRGKFLSFTHGTLSSGATNISEMFKIDQVVLSNGLYNICFTNDHMLEITNGTSSREQVAPLRTFTTSNSFEIVLTAFAGQISPIADQNIPPNSSSGPISFSFGNLGTTAGSSLQISVTSSNQTLVPNANLVIGGSGTNRTLTVSPAAGQTGKSLVTISVTDGIWTNSRSFNVVVANFTLTTSPLSQSALAGNSVNYTNIVSATNGSGTVSLSVSGLPSGSIANFVPPTFTDSGTNTLNVSTTTNVAPGTYPLTITATAGSQSATNSVALVVTNIVAAPGTMVWIGTNNWSVALNWTNLTGGGNGPPGIANDVVFTNFATVAASNSINNIVNSDTTVNSLTFDNTNGFHTTQINAGKTLTIVGSKGLLVGTESDLGSNAMVNVAITGAGGALVVSNPASTILIRQYTSGSANVQRATLDLSGLDTFTAIANTFEAGMWGGGGTIRTVATVYLARTNFLNFFAQAKGGTTNAGIDVADSPSANSSQFSFLFLGQQNRIYTDGITVGGGRNIGWMGFNSAFNDSLAFVRGTNGDSSRVARWLVGDNSGASGTGSNSRGTNDFTGGTIDAMVDQMIIGRGESPTMGSGSSTGVVMFAQGTIDVNNLQMGVQASGATGGLTSGTAGTNYVGQMDVDGTATLTVNSNFQMTSVNVGSVGAMSLLAILNVNGGTVETTNVIGGSGTSLINLNSGTIDLQGGCITNVTMLNIGDSISSAAQLLNAAKITSPTVIIVAANGMLAGNTIITSPNLLLNGTVSPGDVVVGAITNTGNITFGAGGRYLFDMQDAGGQGGTNWDLLASTGVLNIQAVSTNPFIVQLRSIDGNLNDENPGAANFGNASSQSWPIASGSSVTNFASNQFSVDADAFQNDLAGGYFIVTTNGNSLLLTFIPNNPPSANDAAFYLPSSGTLQIPISSLVPQWSDPDGDPIQFAGVNSNSDNGTNNVSSDGTYIYFTGAPNLADTISYTIGDVRTNPPGIYRAGDTQQTATGIIHILPPPAIGKLTMDANNLIFSGSDGAPDGTFYILASTNVALPLSLWTVIATNSFDADGNFNFTNPVDANNLQQFYLLKFP